MGLDSEYKHWESRWTEGRTGWDVGKPHPYTSRLLDKLYQTDPKSLAGLCYIPGCGRAHDAVALLNFQFEKVVCVDLIPQAIDEAKRIYGANSKLQFQVADAIDDSFEFENRVSLVFDRAMLCAIPPIMRSKYLESMMRLLRPGGKFVSIAFTKTTEPDMGPPYQIEKNDLRSLFGTGWKICFEEELESGFLKERILSETLFCAEKINV